MNLPTFAIESIQTPASIIQFAKDGKYEEAWIVSSGDPCPSQTQIKDYLCKDKFDKLIVEFIWNPDDNESRYVLTVIFDGTCRLKGNLEFVTTCLEIFYSQLPFNDAIQQINQQVIGSDFLFSTPVEAIRLGVFNHWFSVGPIDLWLAGEPIDDEVIRQKIDERPEVKESTLNYQGLAFIYNFSGQQPGPYHVFKTPCCHENGVGWIVDTDLVTQTIHKFI
jgi:hypothetical protein